MTMRIHGDKIEFPDGTEQFTASTGSGGSGGEAQPPVAFRLKQDVANTIESDVITKVVNFISKLDTENGFNETEQYYEIKKSGIYNISYSVRAEHSKLSSVLPQLKKESSDGTEEILTSPFYDFTNINPVKGLNTSGDWTGELKVGDKLTITCRASTTDASAIKLTATISAHLSGHMVSSFTEGEVKEKEPVVFRARITANQTITSGDYTKVELDTIYTDTSGKKVGNEADLVDGKFKPSVAGYYQVNGSVSVSCNPRATQIAACIYKNGNRETISPHFESVNAGRTNVVDIIYLDPENKWTDTDGNEQVGDYIELWGIAVATGTCAFTKDAIYTFLSAHLITGQSSGGGTGTSEATGTPSSFARIVDEKPKSTNAGASIAGIQDRTLNKVEYDVDNIVTLSDDKEFTLQKGTYVINFSSPAYAVSNHAASLYSVTDSVKVAQGTSSFAKASFDVATHSFGSYSVTLTAPHTYKVQQYTYAAKNINGLGNASESGVSIFTTVDIQKVGTGGASSGGSYTPEKMVWEDKLSERELDTIYKNENNVPLYINIKLNHTANALVELYVDGDKVSWTGAGLEDKWNYSSIFYVIPANSSYSVKTGFITGGAPDGTVTMQLWQEARMPVAVGTGGKTVAFRGELSVNQTVSDTSWSKVNLDTASTDTDNALIDGKFQPSVSGYYQVNGAVTHACIPPSTQTVAQLRKNDSVIARGAYASTDSSQQSNVSDVVYLNGTTDYIELWGSVKSTGTLGINSNKEQTFLSAVLVSGGSASGGKATSLTTASGSAPSYSARAWVNFNGTGTVAIRASGNVSSITDNGVGNYTVNFITAMPDVNYASVCGSSTVSGAALNYSFGPIDPNNDAPTTTSRTFARETSNGTASDPENAEIAIFR